MECDTSESSGLAADSVHSRSAIHNSSTTDFESNLSPPEPEDTTPVCIKQWSVSSSFTKQAAPSTNHDTAHEGYNSSCKRLKTEHPRCRSSGQHTTINKSRTIESFEAVAERRACRLSSLKNSLQLSAIFFLQTCNFVPLFIDLLFHPIYIFSYHHYEKASS